MYKIGEILNKFTKNSLAYCIQGALEGAFIICDKENKGRLFNLTPDGHCDYDFYFRIDDTIEDIKEWIFVNEIEDKEIQDEIYNKLTKSIIESIKNGYEFKLV
jgi:hypothetical protein